MKNPKEPFLKVMLSVGILLTFIFLVTGCPPPDTVGPSASYTFVFLMDATAQTITKFRVDLSTYVITQVGTPTNFGFVGADQIAHFYTDSRRLPEGYGLYVLDNNTNYQAYAINSTTGELTAGKTAAANPMIASGIKANWANFQATTIDYYTLNLATANWPAVASGTLTFAGTFTQFSMPIVSSSLGFAYTNDGANLRIYDINPQTGASTGNRIQNGLNVQNNGVVTGNGLLAFGYNGSTLYPYQVNTTNGNLAAGVNLGMAAGNINYAYLAPAGVNAIYVSTVGGLRAVRYAADGTLSNEAVSGFSSTNPMFHPSLAAAYEVVGNAIWPYTIDGTSGVATLGTTSVETDITAIGVSPSGKAIAALTNTNRVRIYSINQTTGAITNTAQQTAVLAGAFGGNILVR